MLIAFLAIAGILIVPGARAQQQQRHPELHYVSKARTVGVTQRQKLEAD
jgi:hypothetical protein